MINKLTIELSLPSNIKPNYLGSILHGVIMDYLSTDMAAQLHHYYAYSPLKQRIYLKNHLIIWEIISMNDNLSGELIEIFSKNETLFLKHYHTHIQLKTFIVTKFNIKEMMNGFLGKDDLSRFIHIKIQTPMSFKMKNEYLIFLDINRFFRSIMIQFDSFFDNYKMYDKETLDFIESNVKIVDYKLKSTKFYLEKVKIPSFTGELSLKVKGPLPFLQLIYFLLEFGELSGVGIKTSLGMGKYSIIERENKK
ncbi:CRISPR-associated endoribonuclease Cas6 [Staphylococcus ursi]|uniref:CRISPR-associated endoribonuclease Cas6 n=1 Tax=Staphylococcus sp. MI 10-1553 TaxID=1912064 RepID=UPI00139885CE|nr:CRISPR-associated endoribonuclease Cas6 [Staphylococcus sp. MI 10-1553]QHW35989.1 CRISPR-associated endoribonuclease Cas6 [Staphylococcus sp. MI 10-1553]